MKRSDVAQPIEVEDNIAFDSEVVFEDAIIVRICQIAGNPLSDRDYAYIFLEAINNGAIPDSNALCLQSGIDVEIHPSRTFLLPAALHEQYIELLLTAINSPDWPSTTVVSNIALRLRGKIVAIPVPSLEDGEFCIQNRTFAVNLHAALEYASLVLLSRFRRDICQCKLPTCRIFFLVEPVPRGRPRREYCTPEHRKEFFNSRGAERVEASRAGVTTKKWREVKASMPGITATKWLRLRSEKKR